MKLTLILVLAISLSINQVYTVKFVGPAHLMTREKPHLTNLIEGASSQRKIIEGPNNEKSNINGSDGQECKDKQDSDDDNLASWGKIGIIYQNQPISSVVNHNPTPPKTSSAFKKQEQPKVIPANKVQEVQPPCQNLKFEDAPITLPTINVLPKANQYVKPATPPPDNIPKSEPSCNADKIQPQLPILPKKEDSPIVDYPKPQPSSQNTDLPPPKVKNQTVSQQQRSYPKSDTLPAQPYPKKQNIDFVPPDRGSQLPAPINEGPVQVDIGENQSRNQETYYYTNYNFPDIEDYIDTVDYIPIHRSRCFNKYHSCNQ